MNNKEYDNYIPLESSIFSRRYAVLNDTDDILVRLSKDYDIKIKHINSMINPKIDNFLITFIKISKFSKDDEFDLFKKLDNSMHIKYGNRYGEFKSDFMSTMLSMIEVNEDGNN